MILFFSLFWSWAASFGAVDDGICRVFPIFLFGPELLRVSFWQNSQVVHRLFQDRQQAVYPFIGLRLSDPEQFAHDGLQWITLLLDQRKEQFLVYTIQRSFTTNTGFPFSAFACHGL